MDKKGKSSWKRKYHTHLEYKKYSTKKPSDPTTDYEEDFKWIYLKNNRKNIIRFPNSQSSNGKN